MEAGLRAGWITCWRNRMTKTSFGCRSRSRLALFRTSSFDPWSSELIRGARFSTAFPGNNLLTPWAGRGSVIVAATAFRHRAAARSTYESHSFGHLSLEEILTWRWGQ